MTKRNDSVITMAFSRMERGFSRGTLDSIKKKLMRCITNPGTTVIIENIFVDKYLDAFRVFCEEKGKDILRHVVFRDCTFLNIDGFCKEITCRFEHCSFFCMFNGKKILEASFYECTFFPQAGFQKSSIQHTTFEKCSFTDSGMFFTSLSCTSFQECIMDVMFKLVECEARELSFARSEFFSCFSVVDSTFEDIDFSFSTLSEMHCVSSSLSGTKFTTAYSILNLVVEDCIDAEVHTLVGPMRGAEGESFYMLLFENGISYFHGKRYETGKLVDHILKGCGKAFDEMSIENMYKAFMAILSIKAAPLARDGFFPAIVSKFNEIVLDIEKEVDEENPFEMMEKSDSPCENCRESMLEDCLDVDAPSVPWGSSDHEDVNELSLDNFHSMVIAPEHTKSLGELCYRSEVTKNIERIMLLYKKRKELRERGIGEAMHVLLHGAPGNGKSVLAGAIAKELGLPFYILDVASIRSRYIGDAGGNVSKVFRGIKKYAPACVFFLDECDSIAAVRSYESGASKDDSSTLNSLLTQMDDLSDDCILIAATNVLEELDPAFLRRFQQQISIEPPRKEDIEKYLSMYECRKGFRLGEKERQYLFDLAGISWSDVEHYVVASHQNHVIGYPNDAVIVRKRKGQSLIRGFASNL